MIKLHNRLCEMDTWPSHRVSGITGTVQSVPSVESGYGAAATGSIANASFFQCLPTVILLPHDTIIYRSSDSAAVHLESLGFVAFGLHVSKQKMWLADDEKSLR